MPVEDIGRFAFIRLAVLRTEQLRLGCTPRVPPGRKYTTTARQEIAERKVCGEDAAGSSAPLAEPRPA